MKWEIMDCPYTKDMVCVQPNRVHPSEYREHVLPAEYDIEANIVGGVPRREKRYTSERRSLYIEVQANNGDKKQLLNAIIDTGAQSVCVKKGVAEKLGYKKIGQSRIGGATGSETVGVYVGSFIVCFDDPTKNLYLTNVVFFEASLPGNTDMLIGQPIIKRFQLEVFEGFKGFAFVDGGDNEHIGDKKREKTS